MTSKKYNSEEIYSGTKVSDLFKEIHMNSKSKNRQIERLIVELQPLIKTVNDAVIIVPLIKEYLDVSVKNDDQLIKLAGIVQRFVAASTKKTSKDNSSIEEDFHLTDEERAELMKEIEALKAQP